jgi:hypothetical protein
MQRPEASFAGTDDDGHAQPGEGGTTATGLSFVPFAFAASDFTAEFRVKVFAGMYDQAMDVSRHASRHSGENLF